MKERDPTNRHILLIEDDPDQAQLTQRILEQHDHLHVTQKPDADTAIETLHELSPHQLPKLVLLDINLGNDTGFDVLQAMRDHEKLATVPVIVLTTSPDDQDCKQSYHHGANGFLTRPLRYEELETTLHATVTYWIDNNKTPYSTD